MPLNFDFKFDFKNPDYTKVFEHRFQHLKMIREDPDSLFVLRPFYRKNPAQFINDWGCTCDPRNIPHKPAIIPFILFPKQEEWINCVFEDWMKGESRVTEKSRDAGVSWLSTSLAATLCMFFDNIKISFGSRKEEYVDKRGDPKSLFYKIRQFISLVPEEFSGIWEEKRHCKHMNIFFPGTESVITGEAGANIGRGDRSAIYFIDEAAHLQHSSTIEKALSMTTNCRQDISTPKGMDNPFAKKIHSGSVHKFTFHWRSDPRKDESWYLKKCEEINDPVIIAQELDLDYKGSVENVVIPSAWVQASIDIHKKIGCNISGIKKYGFDVADEGGDLNAIILRHGILVKQAKTWSGKESDIYLTVVKVFEECDLNDVEIVDYDADGLGAGVRGDAKNINDKRKYKIDFNAFRGSGEVLNPEHDAFNEEGQVSDRHAPRKNVDFFLNRKAQAWWALRRKFQKVYRLNLALKENNNEFILDANKIVIKNDSFVIDDLISIDSNMDNFMKLVIELSQPTYSQNEAGKLKINKKPDGARSPNLADALLIAFAPNKKIHSGFFQ